MSWGWSCRFMREGSLRAFGMRVRAAFPGNLKIGCACLAVDSQADRGKSVRVTALAVPLAGGRGVEDRAQVAACAPKPLQLPARQRDRAPCALGGDRLGALEVAHPALSWSRTCVRPACPRARRHLTAAERARLVAAALDPRCLIRAVSAP